MNRIGMCLVVLLLAVGRSLWAEDLAREHTWSSPQPAAIKAELDNWLSGQPLTDVQRQEAALLWPADVASVSPHEILDQVALVLAFGNAEAKEVVTFARGPRKSLAVPEFKALADSSQPPLVRNNLQLLLGAWLAQHDMHEEALVRLDALDVAEVVDPAALLFYRAVCHHRLRDKEKCLPALAKLLERETEIPRRYRDVARLMQADLEPLEPDTLDEIARLMDSVRRRLDLGRVGTRVQSEEEDVVTKLDKLIQEMEKKREEQQQKRNQARSQPQPSKPLDDSKPSDVRGKGEVDPKELADRGGWGNLPPKERQQALQQISKDLPAHYREAIEEYFRKLARDGGK